MWQSQNNTDLLWSKKIFPKKTLTLAKKQFCFETRAITAFGVPKKYKVGGHLDGLGNKQHC